MVFTESREASEINKMNVSSIVFYQPYTAPKVKTLYITMIRSVLEYGASTWSPYYTKDIDLLEKVQKRCLRLSTAD